VKKNRGYTSDILDMEYNKNRRREYFKTKSTV